MGKSPEGVQTIEVDDSEFYVLFSDRRDQLDGAVKDLAFDTVTVACLVALAAEIAVSLGHTEEEYLNGAKFAIRGALEAEEDLPIN